MRWAIRGIGLVSTVLLARLLAPEDFGLIAMAMTAVALLEVFTQSGTDLALLRASEPSREDYDAAWTLEIIQGSVLAVALFLSAPLVASFFSDARIVPVIQLLSLRAFLGGFQNIGVVVFRREFAFDKEFRFGVLQKLATFSVTVVAALVLRNYWALVVGQLVGRLFEVAISFAMCNYRPRLQFAGIRGIWAFSKWMIVQRFARLLNQQFDRWAVGRTDGATAMGVYYVASDVAASPADEVVLPMSRAAFPVYSRLLQHPEELKTTFLTVLASMASISIAIGVGIALVANDLVRLFLGEKWIAAIDLIPYFGVFGAAYGIVHTIDLFLLATGRERVAAYLTIANALMACGVVMIFAANGAHALAMAKALLGLLFVANAVAVLGRKPPVSSREAIVALLPAVASAATMSTAVWGLRQLLDPRSPALGLLLDASIGAACYTSMMMVVWLLRGRPAGIESQIWLQLQALRPGMRP